MSTHGSVEENNHANHEEALKVDNNNVPKDSCSEEPEKACSKDALNDSCSKEPEKACSKDVPNDTCSKKPEETCSKEAPNNTCITNQEKACSKDVTQACCNGGDDNAELCTSTFNTAESYPTSTPGNETQLEQSFADLTLRQDDDNGNDTQGLTFLYRVLRPEENPKDGLVAKNPHADKSESSHVNNGSGAKYKSQFKSTSATLEAAKEFRSKRNPRSRIGIIDVSQLPPGTEVINLTTQENRDHYLGDSDRIKNYARKFEEVLLVNRSSSIPFTYYEE